MKDIYGFELYDRELQFLDSYKIEIADFYKDNSIFAVKIGGNSAKLSYALNQSSAAINLNSILSTSHTVSNLF